MFLTHVVGEQEVSLDAQFVQTLVQLVVVSVLSNDVGIVPCTSVTIGSVTAKTWLFFVVGKS